jgi:type IV secretion system protein VirB4
MHDGTHIDLADTPEPGAIRMSPLALVADPKHLPFINRWVRELIEVGRGGHPLEPHEIAILGEQIHALARLPAEMHRLSHLRSSLGPSLGRYLDEWIGSGARANWFDNEPQLVTIGDEVCFEMKRLFADPEVARLAMDYLFHLVEMSLDGRPVIVNVEETWFFMRHPKFVDRLDDFARTLGKRNGALWITTQGAVELTSDPKILGMLEQFKNRVYLPNAQIITSRNGYDKLGLSEEQLWRIQGAEPKRDYYFQTPSMTRMVQVRVPDHLLHFVSSSTRAIATFWHHYAKRDETGLWKQRYFDEMTGATQ